MESFVITIARGYGSGGKMTAKALSKTLGIKYYDSELIRIASEHSGINEALFNLADETHKSTPFKKYTSTEVVSPKSDNFLSRENLFNLQAQTIKNLADNGESCIIVGRCAHHVLKDRKNVIKVFVHADLEHCIKRVMEHDGVDDVEARRLIEKIDKSRAQYHKYFTNMEWNDARSYDICLNTSRMNIEQCVSVIVEYLNIIKDVTE